MGEQIWDLQMVFHIAVIIAAYYELLVTISPQA